MQQADRDRRERHGLAQESRERLLAARRGQPALELGRSDIGTQIDVEHGFATRGDRLAQRPRQRVNGAALEPAARDDGLAV